jgi:dipeptidyl aminopeptidase/acylaminoacyl peptidase
MCRRLSPTTYVRDISTPVLILHCEDDLRGQVE